MNAPTTKLVRIAIKATVHGQVFAEQMSACDDPRAYFLVDGSALYSIVEADVPVPLRDELPVPVIEGTVRT